MEKKEEVIINMMPLSFYKAGGVFTGNAGSMRYMVKKETDHETERLVAHTWPGPFIYEATKDELKANESFDLSEEGINEASQWLKKEYIDKEDEYSSETSLIESEDKLKEVPWLM